MRNHQGKPTLEQENLAYLRSWAAVTEREIENTLQQIVALRKRGERAKERLELISRLAGLLEEDLAPVGEQSTTIDLTDQQTGGQDGSGTDEADGLEGLFAGEIKEIVE